MRAHRLLAACLALSAIAACANHDGYVLITVDARPAVHGAKALSVTLANGGTMRTDSLDLKGQAFPVTFSVSAPGRTGDLAITVDAVDQNNLVVGHGGATTTTAASKASVQLDSTDFVVNTDYAGTQFPTFDGGESGAQLAAGPDGTWTAVFGDSCTSGTCNLFGRRFDATGTPVQSEVAAGTNAFTLNTLPPDPFAIPAVAASASTTITLWNDTSFGGTTTPVGIKCRSLDAAGRATANQLPIASDDASTVAITTLSTGNFVASWNAFVANPTNPTLDHYEIHLSTIKPDCTALTPTLVIVSKDANPSATNSVATSGSQTLVVWTVASGDLDMCMAAPAGTLTCTDAVLAAKTATDAVIQARSVGVTAGGFVVAVRWQQSSSTGPGRIELLRLDAMGKLVGTPVLVTDKSGSDLSARSLAIASRPDGTVMIVWDACGDLGDGSKCGVFGRILRDTGAPVTDVFTVPTTIEDDQLVPSVAGLPDAFVVVWADASSKLPDTSGQAVRARIVYPPAP